MFEANRMIIAVGIVYLVDTFLKKIHCSQPLADVIVAIVLILAVLFWIFGIGVRFSR